MKPSYATGIYSQINPHFGLVETPEAEVFFVGKRERGNAFDGDTVQVRITKRATDGKKAEAEIVSIVKRTEKSLVGKYLKRAKSSYGFVQIVEGYMGKDIFVQDRDALGATNGDIVTVRVYGEKNKPHGTIHTIIGRSGDPGIEEKMSLFRHGIEEKFPRNVEMEAEGLDRIGESGLSQKRRDLREKWAPEWNVAGATMNEEAELWTQRSSRQAGSGSPRRDLRHECIVTIDGADARDLDDAISVKKLADNTFELAVHIADVAEYVREWGALDREALRRGTSIYLPDRVIPMLPERLSNDLCSLHPHTPKATLSITMRLDASGKVLDRRIEETLIESKHRFTYDEVQEVVDSLSTPLTRGDVAVATGGLKWTSEEGINPSVPNPAMAGRGISPFQGSNTTQKIDYPPEILALIRDALELKRILDRRRKTEGKIEFDFPEVKLITDEQGQVTDIVKRDRNEAHHIIEEFMILANEEISKFFSLKKIPFLYRIHESPSEEGLTELSALLMHFGHMVPKEGITPASIRAVMDTLHEKEYWHVLSKHILRAMSKAAYSEESLGHFGLGLRYYSHFTSPIRRYPDLQIHRIIKAWLRKELDKKEILRYAKLLPRVAKTTSTSERKAEEIEYEIRDIKIVEYMEKRLGKIYPGTISSLAEHGIYIELENGVEWLVYIRDLARYYSLDELSGTLTRRADGRVYRIGESVTIRVAKTDKSLRRLDFELVEG